MKNDKDLEVARMMVDNLSTQKRARLLALYADKFGKASGPIAPGVLTAKKTAEVFNRSTRFVHGLAQQGLLSRVILPGRVRSCGYTKASVMALVGVDP